MIHSMTDLLIVTCNSDFESLKRSVYEYTDCRICITHNNECVCIGCTVEEVESVQLEYPFTVEQWWESVDMVSTGEKQCLK